MAAIGKPPRTHVLDTAATAGAAAGATTLLEFDEKTNNVVIKSSAAWRFAYRGTVAPATLPATGDNAGVGVAANSSKALKLSVGSSQVAGLQVLVENSVLDQVYEIEAEE